jgi:hypothetical protein
MIDEINLVQPNTAENLLREFLLLLGLQHDNKFSYSIYMDNTPEI